jgi:hypothetical protein
MTGEGLAPVGASPLLALALSPGSGGREPMGDQRPMHMPLIISCIVEPI